EAARSAQDPNLYGKALIDSMEGIEQADATPMLRDSWQVAANPQFGSYNIVSDFKGRDQAGSHLLWTDGDVPSLDPTQGNTTIKGLIVGYSLDTTQPTIP